MLAICPSSLSALPNAVLLSYQRALASRGVSLTLHEVENSGPYLVGHCRQSPADQTGHCYWELEDRSALPANASGFKWIWHSGPDRELLDQDRRIILLPRNDLFEIRDIDNTAAGWAEYRKHIDIPWSEKRNHIYFCGHFTGRIRGTHNSRYRACSLIRRHFPR